MEFTKDGKKLCRGFIPAARFLRFVGSGQTFLCEKKPENLHSPLFASEGSLKGDRELSAMELALFKMSPPSLSIRLCVLASPPA